MKERIRKFLVALKRKPHMIPLVVLGVAFLVYSMRLTLISNTTAKIQGPGMGLCGFVIMLFSMLGLVSFGRTFPHRKPVNKFMLALTFCLFIAVMYADRRYISLVNNALTREENVIAVTDATSYINEAVAMLKVHFWLVLAGLGLMALLPVYAPAIKRIKTSINVEENGEMENIDISGEDA